MIKKRQNHEKTRKPTQLDSIQKKAGRDPNSDRDRKNFWVATRGCGRDPIFFWLRSRPDRDPQS